MPPEQNLKAFLVREGQIIADWLEEGI